MLDLARLPHLLVAEQPGRKISCIECHFGFIALQNASGLSEIGTGGPKRVELNLYSKLENHFLAQLPDAESPIIIDTKRSFIP